MARRDLEVIVIGAGMGGLAAAQKLEEYGFTPKILEKAAEVGGTWRDNKYPGLYVDVPVGQYQMLFAPKWDWSHAYAPGDEIQSYLVRIADELDLRKYITFGVEVTSAEWVDGRWVVTTSTGATHTADAVVAATGFLHRKRMPRIDGTETFLGPQFHSSEWPDGLDVRGKRIAVVGSGSSGIQMVCALAEMECEVTQYVRTPQWIETIKNPKAGALARRIGRLLPAVGRRLTDRLQVRIEQDPRLLDPRWKLEPGPKRAAAQQALREDLDVIAGKPSASDGGVQCGYRAGAGAVNVSVGASKARAVAASPAPTVRAHGTASSPATALQHRHLAGHAELSA